jgi:hypothetical protein
VSAVEAHVWLHDGTPTVLDAEVVDADDRTIRVSLGDDDGWLPTVVVTQTTSYSIEYQAVFADGSSITWPDGPPDVLPVRPSGDPAT